MTDIGIEPRLNPPEPPPETPACHCSACGEPIYPGEDYYDLPDGPMCETCVWAARREVI